LILELQDQAIHDTFVQAANLTSYGRRTIQTAKDEYISLVYSVNVMFPNQILARNIRVSEYSDNHEFDFIIGREILQMTDMAITNTSNITVLFLYTPSSEKHIDFTKL